MDAIAALVVGMTVGHVAPALPPVSAVVARAQQAVVSIAGPAGPLGSGFVVRSDGIIATNRHVVADAAMLTVIFPSGERLPGRVRVSHPTHDVALVQVDAGRALAELPLRSSAPLVGEWVVALGNPFGLGPTATVGIIGATGRSLGRTGDAADLVQTDAAINPGNSGGPLCDMDGRVVAVANAAITVGQGIGFGVPIALVRTLLDDLPAVRK